MADEAPAAPAPAAEGAGIYEVYTSPNGYQNYQIWTESTSPDNSTGISIKGTKQYLIVDSTGAWGGYNGLAHGPHPKEGPPPSRETILRRLGLSREETKCFKGIWKTSPFRSTQIGVWKRKSACPSQQVQRGQDSRRSARLYAQACNHISQTTVSYHVCIQIYYNSYYNR